ncbi:aminotransferase class I/II-fold pyridoxal phosphate-dependent enzyme [Agrobacterium vitis]|nr:aminotransferase class I/II-fold pyridoxal phosphate-dependent enzyme [Agrobacterium vitis]MCE6076994.1 aminotransferase class I/II-fold pyridoxal phosphate-dependent enzyme [Agrobacterium vitis]MUO71685.1 aminotransferase class I/II-fold pyridoxal phosphate-dependent enzyme [Agrobacterium vitis]MUO86237.1 aminotransferase class I/II-fold pyridoxal phosphate-dependent enzyme [Agrobacterium vitis]MVA36780.1 aminotransferase class I/II-fold pyridoxal phosphate-dependent enzyme [Agrobacterium v
MRASVNRAPNGLRFDTIAVLGAHDHAAALEARGSICEPLDFGPAQHFGSAEDMRACLAGETDGWVYGRIGNPTVQNLEVTLASLETYGSSIEGEAAATASGMFAIFAATSPFLKIDSQLPGSANIVVSAGCYGGTYMLFHERYQGDRGVEVRWVQPSAPAEVWADHIDAGTRFIFVETPSNPGLALIDVPALAKLAEQHSLPLIVDSTVATPALHRPLSQGADIVVHSASKTMSANGLSIAGALIARKNIRSRVGPEKLRENFARYVKNTVLREIGGTLSPFNALMTLTSLRSLRTNVDNFSASAERIAQFLNEHDAVESVQYPGLPGEFHALACRDLVLVDAEQAGKPLNRFGSLISFRPSGGPDAAFRTLDAMKLFWRANDLGRVKSTATIPAIATHGQLDESARLRATVPADLIRISIGQEHTDDLIADLDAALAEAST